MIGVVRTVPRSKPLVLQLQGENGCGKDTVTNRQLVFTMEISCLCVV